MTDVPGSVLWMSRLAVSNETEARLRSAAASRGVSPDRLLPSKTKEIFGGLLLPSETNSFWGFFGVGGLVLKGLGRMVQGLGFRGLGFGNQSQSEILRRA